MNRSKVLEAQQSSKNSTDSSATDRRLKLLKTPIKLRKFFLQLKYEVEQDMTTENILSLT